MQNNGLCKMETDKSEWKKNYVLKKDFACHLLVYEWIKSIELLNRNGKIQCFFVINEQTNIEQLKWLTVNMNMKKTNSFIIWNVVFNDVNISLMSLFLLIDWWIFFFLVWWPFLLLKLYIILFCFFIWLI